MPGATSANQAVIFDLDDTLYAERDYVLSGYGAISRHLSHDSARADELRQWLWKRFLDGQADGAFNALSDHFSLGLDGEQIVELVGIYREHRPQITPRSGVEALLARLHHDRKLGIVSDGFLPAQEFKLESLGIAQYFDSIIFTETMGRQAWKPSTAGFEAICRELKIGADKCTYIGDNPSKDFAAPNALGWRTVQLLLDGQVHSHKPTPVGGKAQIIVNSIDELDQLLS
ncbi:MAG: HAD family hydrolase [Phycisphaerae bacterium]|jgi:putative hydrolase of the HAD superfamily|nr:HAD family hydrolase [Phycisphaerae bacterium]MDP7289453.1 HAD family hydrolase [Phycisphaerae bacterium]